MLEVIKDFFESLTKDPLKGIGEVGQMMPDIKTPSFVESDLDYSVTLSGKAFRYQRKRYVFQGDEFYKMFEENEHRRMSQGRFTGSYMASGTYLSFTPTGAEREISHYETGLDDFDLITVDSSVDRVLNLTSMNNVSNIIKMFEGGKQIAHSKRHQLEFMMDEISGGDDFTDYIGIWALSQGYQGILYPSVRSLQKYGIHLRDGQGVTELDLSYSIPRLLSDIHVYNILIFSGALFTSNTSIYKINNGPWQKNKYFGWSPEKIEANYSVGARFTNDVDRVLILKKPRYEFVKQY